MDQAVQLGCVLVDLRIVAVAKVVLVRTFGVQDHLQGVVVVVEERSQTVEVEIVANEIFVDLEQKLIARLRHEPGDPAVAGRHV